MPVVSGTGRTSIEYRDGPSRTRSLKELSLKVHLLSTWSAAAVNLAASTDPTIPATTDDQYRDYGPGFAGFVATAALVIVVIFLIWDMTRRIRRIRYQSEAQERQSDMVAAGEEEAAQRKAFAETAALADDESGTTARGADNAGRTAASGTGAASGTSPGDAATADDDAPTQAGPDEGHDRG